MPSRLPLHRPDISELFLPTLKIAPVTSKNDRKLFVDLPFRLYRDDPFWVPPLKTEALGLITPAKNGWFSHAEAQLFLAYEDNRVVGRISAHIDMLALTMPAGRGFGPGVGQWGLMDAEREDIFVALLAHAENWLRIGTQARNCRRFPKDADPAIAIARGRTDNIANRLSCGSTQGRIYADRPRASARTGAGGIAILGKREKRNCTGLMAQSSMLSEKGYSGLRGELSPFASR